MGLSDKLGYSSGWSRCHNNGVKLPNNEVLLWITLDGSQLRTRMKYHPDLPEQFEKEVAILHTTDRDNDGVIKYALKLLDLSN